MTQAAEHPDEPRRNCQPMQFGHRIVVCAIAVGSMVGCHAATEGSAGSADKDAKVRALLEKTLKNLRFIEGGSFQMGDFGPLHSPEKLHYNSSPDNKTLHKVVLDSFSMSAYKTTYADYDIYTAATGKPKVGTDKTTQRYRHLNSAAGLNWQQARDYCQWLGKQLNLPMDLPTEAQWEYAARNRGEFFVFATDNGKSEPGRNVWEFGQRIARASEQIGSSDEGAAGTPSMPLGQFPPTPLGLYDMMTDGFEWVLDWYAADYYRISPERNPTGPSEGKEKVLRSSRSRDGSGLSHGDGMTFERNHRHPDPPKINRITRQADPEANMTRDTTARCVANQTSPVTGAR